MMQRTPSIPLSRSRRLLFSGVACLAILGVTEILIRLFWTPATDKMEIGLWMEPHPSRLWALRPGEIDAFGVNNQVNSDHLRQTPIDGHELRALTLGDSSVYGHGLPDADTPHQALEDALGALGIGADVLSGATPGYSSIQALRLLDEVGWKQDPDLLIIGTLWSDTNVRSQSDGDWMKQFDMPTQSVHTWMSIHIKTWAFLSEKLHAEEETVMTITWATQEGDTEATFRRVSPSHYAYNLDRMLMQVVERGKSAIFLQPCNKALLTREGDLSATGWEVYFETMETIAERRGVPVVKGCQVLVEAGVSPDAAFIDDMHPSAISNRHYASAMAQALADAGWPAAPVAPDPGPELWTYEVKDRWLASRGKPRIDIREDPHAYFQFDDDTLLVPLDQITHVDVDNELIIEESLKMNLFVAGETPQRRPIILRQTETGSYEVVKGMTTYNIAWLSGWAAIPATITE